MLANTALFASKLAPTRDVTSAIGNSQLPIYHGKDLRKGRFSEVGRPYLVTAVTRDRMPLFKDLWLARLVVNELRREADTGHAENFAWVVMPDHLHWLLAPKTASLAEIVQRAKSRSAIAMNRALDRKGPIWQKGFHDRALRREENLVAMARYVVANPLRAGLVTHIGDYPHWDAVWL